ncbi:MAG: ribbon-helix-helix protein, CopG family [Microlunatus sp.]
MADVLIRNVDDEDLRRIDALAADQGISRNELLRREAHEVARRHALSQVSLEDLQRVAKLARGVLDEDLMRRAWE